MRAQTAKRLSRDGSREAFEALQATYRAAYDARYEASINARVRYGSQYAYGWSTKVRAAYDKLDAQETVVYDAIMAWLRAFCRWDVFSGTSAHWVCTEFTYDMATGTTAPLLPAKSAGYGSPQRDRKPEPLVAVL